MYDSDHFYTRPTNKLRPGDIIYIEHWNAIDDSYWILLTSLCDLEHRDHIVLSKIKKIESIQNIDEGTKGLIRRYRFLYYFYLPPLENEFPESIAHYGMIRSFSRQMLSRAIIDEIDCRRVKSLSDDARKLFNFHFANHFTRDENNEYFKPYIEGFVKNLKKKE